MKGYNHVITIKMQGHRIEEQEQGLYSELKLFIERYTSSHLAANPACLTIQYDYQPDGGAAVQWLEHPLLTERQCKIVQLLIQHYSTKRIAEQMFISENTVKKHIQNIKRSLNLTSSGNDFVFDVLREMEKVYKRPSTPIQ